MGEEYGVYFVEKLSNYEEIWLLHWQNNVKQIN